MFVMKVCLQQLIAWVDVSRLIISKNLLNDNKYDDYLWHVFLDSNVFYKLLLG